MKAKDNEHLSLKKKKEKDNIEHHFWTQSARINAEHSMFIPIKEKEN